MAERPRADARRVALDALVRIDDGAYANLAVPAILGRSGLATRDRAFVTELTYGTTRMRRACDWAVDRFLTRDPPAEARAALRLGTYQLVFLQTPPHAAVSATVAAVARPLRGLVNAVLRRVVNSLPIEWPDAATRLSYPDWILEVFEDDLGTDAAIAALEQMNTAGEVHERGDGYVQDPASQEVAAHVDAGPHQLVLDACAAPGGKSTLMATGRPALVAAVDVHPARANLIAVNVRRLEARNVAAVAADSRVPPWRPDSFDRVLVDAPCSGLGVLRRRPDARWRVGPDDVETLAALQRQLVDAAAPLVRRDGVLVYSACTLTAAETSGVDEWLAEAHPEFVAEPPPDGAWHRLGRGARILPQDAGTDGMYVLRLRRRAGNGH